MTSVQNHQRPLNGNKWLLLLFAITLSSCGLLSDITSPKYNRKGDQVVVKKRRSRVDTVSLKKKSRHPSEKVIRSYEEKAPEVDKTLGLTVGLYAPFTSGSKKRVQPFYAGAKMALSGRNAENIKLKVFDTDGLSLDERHYKREYPEGVDVILGPYKTDDIKSAMRYAKNSNVWMLTPWNSGAVDVKWDRYIQFSPGLMEHFKYQLAHGLKSFRPEEIAVLMRNSDRSLVSRIEQETGMSLNRLEINDMNVMASEDIQEMMVEKRYKAIIMPQWRSSDFTYILSSLTKLNFAKGENDLRVYLLSTWLDDPRMDYDYLNSLNAHFSSTKYVQSYSQKEEDFVRSYYERYGEMPNADAFQGYDLMMYLVGLSQLPKSEMRSYFTSDNCDACFKPVNIYERNMSDGGGQSYLYNRAISIYAFENYKFRKVQ